MIAFRTITEQHSRKACIGFTTSFYGLVSLGHSEMLSHFTYPGKHHNQDMKGLGAEEDTKPRL